jgi:ABC-type bacteriocin/lantibiotic exporter with double-glycine peptidase domain
VLDKVNWIWIARRLKPMWRRITTSLALAGISGILATLDPLLIRQLIDVALPQRRAALSLALALGVTGCLLGRIGFLLCSLYLDFDIQQEFSQGLRISILERLTNISAEFHERTPVGDTVTRLERDVDQIAELGSQIASSTLLATVFFTANVAIMVRLNARMTLAIVPALIGFLFVRGRLRSFLHLRADAAQSEAGRANSLLFEHLAALPQLQMLGAEAVLIRKGTSVWMGLLRARKGQRATELLYSGLISLIVVLATLCVLILGVGQVIHASLSIGGFVAFYAYAMRMFEPVSSMMEVYSRAQRVGASVRRVRGILEVQSTIPDDGVLIVTSRRIGKGIRFEEVSFSYVADRYALRGVSLQIEPGEQLAIVGQSGSGKSTIARLLVRLSDPQQGEILLDGIPHTSYTLAALRRAVCCVPQHPILFDGSISENLRYANPAATSQQLKRVIAAAQLDAVLARLPLGTETKIGPSGYTLSGGERQRVALARSLLRESPILVLDESTSALDSPTEQSLLESIARQRFLSILIIISHRLASLKWMDRIVVLDRGRIVAAGSHGTLHERSAVYRKLCAIDSRMSVNDDRVESSHN